MSQNLFVAVTCIFWVIKDHLNLEGGGEKEEKPVGKEEMVAKMRGYLVSLSGGVKKVGKPGEKDYFEIMIDYVPIWAP